MAASELADRVRLGAEMIGSPTPRGFVRPSLAASLLLALLLIGAVTDAALAITGAIAPLNYAATAYAYGFEPGWLTPVMVALTLLGEDPPLDAFAVALAFWTYRSKERLYAFAMIGVAVAARIVGVAMKYVVRQPRPFLRVPPHPLSILHGYGYPSGHAVLSMAILGFGAAVLLKLLSRRRARWLATIVCAVLIAGIGWSRVYLGFHWVNDVVGGYLDGATVAAAGWVVQDRVRAQAGRRATDAEGAREAS